MKLAQLKEAAKNRYVQLSAVAVTSIIPAIAMADEDQVTGAISALQVKILGYVQAGIAAAIVLLLASLAADVGVSVAKKWLRKGAS